MARPRHPRVASVGWPEGRVHPRRAQRVRAAPRLLRGRAVPRQRRRGPGAHRGGARVGGEPVGGGRRRLWWEARLVRVFRHLRSVDAAVHEVEPHGRALGRGRDQVPEVLRRGRRSAAVHPGCVLARRAKGVRRVLGALADVSSRREHLWRNRQGRRVQVRGRGRACGSQVHRRAPRPDPRHVLHRQGAGHRGQGWQDQAVERVHATDVRAQPRQDEGNYGGRVLQHVVVPERQVALHSRPGRHRGRPDPRRGHVLLRGFRD